LILPSAVEEMSLERAKPPPTRLSTAVNCITLTLGAAGLAVLKDERKRAPETTSARILKMVNLLFILFFKISCKNKAKTILD
jgi:hypothetical protein